MLGKGILVALAVSVPLFCGAETALSVEDVLRLGRTEANEGRSVCATGVVTLVANWRAHSGVIAPVSALNGRGVYFSGEQMEYDEQRPVATLSGTDRLRVGDLVEVRGTTSALAFAPGIRANSIVRLGSRSLPPYPLRRVRDLDHAVLDNARVALRGVLADVREIPGLRDGAHDRIAQLYLQSSDGAFVANVPGETEAWRNRLDAELEVSGCAMSTFNLRAEFRSVQMSVASTNDITVVRPAPPDWRSVPRCPVSELLAFSPVPYDGHARRVRGLVTYCGEDGTFCLQEGKSGLKVRFRAGMRPELRRGDEIEAVGFPWQGAGGSEFICVACSSLGARALPDPLDVYLNSYARWQYERDGYTLFDYSWLRLKFRARLLRVTEYDGATELLVADGPVTTTVRVRGRLTDDLRTAADDNPLVEVTAVAELSLDDMQPSDQMPLVRSVSFVTDDPSSIVFVPDAEWRVRRVHRSLIWAGLAIIVLLVGVVACGLARVARDKRRREQADAIKAERNRMAGDLHDSLEQNLTGARMMMQSALALSPDTPAEVVAAVNDAAEILRIAKAEVRETVFNLRCDDLFNRSPEEVFRQLAHRLGKGPVEVRCKLRGLPERLAGTVLSDLIYIVQEAVTNAVKHGKAKRIVLVSDPLPAVGFRVRVLNDGEAFDPATALGPDAGHFGLVGMRERARRNGLAVFWERDGDWNSVRIEVKR